MSVEIGKTYTAYRQGRAITPQTLPVRVAWVDGDDVYYQVDGRPFVEQTTLARFEEIIDPHFRLGDGRVKYLGTDDSENGMAR